jgi:uncharacterized protein
VLRVTANTNVFISGLNFKSQPFDIVELARKGLIEVAISEPIIEEIKRVLKGKFNWPDECVLFIERQIRSFSRLVEPKQRIDAITDDPTDNRILECAAASGSEYLVTGDKHLLKLSEFQGVKIIAPADFVEIQM